MIRLHLLVEGQTEEVFARELLAMHLGDFNISLDARRAETSRNKKSHKIYRGGLTSYQKVKRDLERWMKEDSKAEAFFTTMFDLYALPEDFPDFAQAKQQYDPYRRVEQLEQAFANDLGHPRFVPYLQLYEFEALLLADPQKFDDYFEADDKKLQNLICLSEEFDSPELINDGIQTAPSKRIITEIPEYKGVKSSVGPIIARHIGLPLLRAKCPHFDNWLQRLESLNH